MVGPEMSQKNPELEVVPICLSVPTAFMLWVTFSPVPECDEAWCWKFKKRPRRGPRNSVVESFVPHLIYIEDVKLYTPPNYGCTFPKKIVIYSADMVMYSRKSMVGESNMSPSRFYDNVHIF